MIAVLLTLWCHAAPVAVDDVPNPRATNSWITDMADVLPAEQEARIEARLEALHRELTAEVVVVTVDDVQAASPQAFRTELFNHWKIGDAKANNGFLVVLVMDQRRLEMETGYGLEGVLPDSWLAGVREDLMVPRFRAGDFPGGMEAGIAAIDDRLRRYPTEVREGTRQVINVDGHDMNKFGADTPPDRTGLYVLGGSLGGVGLLGCGGWLYWRRRERLCPEHNVYMPLLSDTAEDEHLDEDQELEEAIGSINWKVHQCPQCDEVRTFRAVRWMSGHSKCPQCTRRTRTSRSRIVRSATTHSSGLRRISESCANCSYKHTYTRTIPRISKSSSSSGGGYSGGSSSGGSSGGSFGGGSSGGGGGGSSW